MSTFTKLRGVTLPNLAERIATLTDADWDDLYNDWLYQLVLDSVDIADALGIPDTVDSMAVMSRLYLAYADRFAEGPR